MIIFIYAFMSYTRLVIVCGLLWHAEQVELLLSWLLACSFQITLLELFRLLNARHNIILYGRLREFSLDFTSELTQFILNRLIHILFFVHDFVKRG